MLGRALRHRVLEELVQGRHAHVRDAVSRAPFHLVNAHRRSLDQYRAFALCTLVRRRRNCLVEIRRSSARVDHFVLEVLRQARVDVLLRRARAVAKIRRRQVQFVRDATRVRRREHIEVLGGADRGARLLYRIECAYSHTRRARRVFVPSRAGWLILMRGIELDSELRMLRSRVRRPVPVFGVRGAARARVVFAGAALRR